MTLVRILLVLFMVGSFLGLMWGDAEERYHNAVIFLFAAAVYVISMIVSF